MSNNHSNFFAQLKAVIFDYGEVLCHRPEPAEMMRLADFFRVPIARFPEIWEKNRGAYDRGDLSPEQYWSMLAADAGTKLSPAQLDEVHKLDLSMWSNINPHMIDWLHRLQRAGLKIGLLSNMHSEMVAHCRNQFDWIQSFDFVTFSAEANMIKPNSDIYEHTLRGLGVTAPQALFLDDRQVNIDAARALGVHAIRVKSMPQLRTDLQTAGFTILPEVS
jgi:putative hydrolase of the HAD superfamily